MRDKIISGTLWSSLNLVASRGLDFVVKLILARLLLPEHFGIVGMAIVFTSVISVIGEMGLAASLIRSKDKDATPTHYHTAFWASLVFNILIYAIIAILLAPFAAWFYDEDILRLVLPVLGLSVLILPFSLIPRIIITRNLDFKRLNLIQIIPTIISGLVSITMALMGFGVWSIVVHSVIGAALTTPFYWISVDWRPKIEFSYQALRQILGFGVYDTLQNTLVALTNRIDYLIIGKLIGATPLGLYTLAFVLTDTFRGQIMGILNKVMFPVYGKIQTDRALMKKYYLKVIRYNTALVTGMMLILFLYAEPIISVLFGEKWLGTAFPLQMMAIASVIHSIGGTSNSLIKSIGRADIDFKLTFIKTLLITIPAFYFFTVKWGIDGASIAVVLHKLASRIMYQLTLKKHFYVKEIEIVYAIYPAVTGTAVVLLFYILIHLFMTTLLYNYAILSIVLLSSIVFYLLTIMLIMKSDIKTIIMR